MTCTGRDRSERCSRCSAQPWSGLQAATIVVAMAFAVLYLSAVGPFWKVGPDSAMYVLGAESLAEGNGYMENGAPVPVVPPGTSALLAVAWIVGGHTYYALNAEVALFALASFALTYLLFHRTLGALGSGAVVLSCMGSVELFQLSGLLLSDVFFLFFSLLALWCHQRGRTKAAVLSTLATCLVRLVGVSLAVALLVDHLRKRPRRWAEAAGYTLPLLFVALWELRNRRLGWSYTELMLENEPWVRSSGHVGVGGLLSRLVDNLAYSRELEHLLTNGLTHQLGAWAIAPGIVLGVLSALGFRHLMRSGYSAAGIYCVVFAIVVALYWPSVAIRFLLPLLPFFFAFLIAGVQVVARGWERPSVYAPAALFLVLYLSVGFREALPVIAENHGSAFPGQVVKYPSNEDVQKLALWWKEHAAADDVLAFRHPNVMQVVTGRASVAYRTTKDPGALEEDLRSKGASALLLSFRSDADREVAHVADRSEHLRLVRQEGKARLYELTDDGPS